MSRFLIALCFALSSAFSSQLLAAMPENFFEVSPGIYRSAQPAIDDLEDLKSAGIKTIVDLNDDHGIVAEERAKAEELGVTFLHRPMSGFWRPDDQQVNEILSQVRNPENYPLLIHCQYGEDRTGLIVGLHRVEEEKWNPEAAYGEMLERGFHPVLIFLKRYFKYRTGFDD